MILPDEKNRRTFGFTNSYGEPLTLTVDVDHEIGVLTSSDFDDVLIENDRIQNADLILSEGEFNWVTGVWRRVFGRDLEKLPFTKAMDVARKLQRELGADCEGAP